MNYLAHVFLSGRSADAVIGGLLGDFVKGSVGSGYEARVWQGIVLHRRIDGFTDAHEVVQASRRLVSRERRRFAGIMVDVFYDHFLARHWPRYADIPLDEFTREVYAVLLHHRDRLPERLRYIVPRMVGDDWLGTYRELWRVGAALDGISRRLRRSNTLVGGVRELESNYDRFEHHFLSFFPQLMLFVDQWKTAEGISEASVWKATASRSNADVVC
ncbi:MAG: ACP phosphodiesterase [Acidiferrobacterales bacterium]